MNTQPRFMVAAGFDLFAWAERDESPTLEAAPAEVPVTANVHNVDVPYSLTDAERIARYESQGGKCLICAEHEATDADHNHATGEVRGLLCNRCNTLLGKVRERPSRLRRLAKEKPIHASLYLKAANYLEVFGNSEGRFSAWTHNAKSSDDAALLWLDYYRKNLAR